MSSLPHFILHPFSLLPSFLRPTKIGPKRSLLLGLILGFSFSLSLAQLASYVRERYKRRYLSRPGREEGEGKVEIRKERVVEGVEGLIGNTPLIRINSLSDLTGVEILGKCEYLNPFGSVKDRVSLRIIQQAEEEGLIHPHTGSTIFEGTSGSTGISIAGIAKARGYNAHIIVPDDIAEEKIGMLRVLGATVEKVRPVSIVDPKHYVNLARQRALEFGHSSTTQHTIRSTTSASSPSSTPVSTTPRNVSRSNSSTRLPDLLITQDDEDSPSNNSNTGDKDRMKDHPRGLFADQFENLSNYLAHSQSTAPEIHSQTSGIYDAFVSGAGTGGTIAGVGKTLKKLSRGRVEVVLSDPEGSGLFFRVTEGVMWSEREEEGKRRRYQVDTIVEGIGLNRITRNLRQALPIIDDAYRVTDSEALSMSRHLALNDGLFLGSSSAVNLVACVRLAQKWMRDGKAADGGRRLRIVTILCDSGSRHTSKFWNDEYLSRNKITFPSNLDWLFPSSTPPSPHHSHSSSPPKDDGLDHGERNPMNQDEDLASSAPRDLPPLELEMLDPKPIVAGVRQRER